MSELRSAVWQSIVTHDTRRYSLRLYDHWQTSERSSVGHREPAKNWLHERLLILDTFLLTPNAAVLGKTFGKLYPLSLSALANSVIESELFDILGAHKVPIATASDSLKHPVRSNPFLDEIGDVSAEIR